MVDPALDAVIVTPIANLIYKRPMVMAGQCKLSLGLSEPGEAIVGFDGQEKIDFSSNYTIQISPSDYKLQLINFKRGKFFQNIDSRLKRYEGPI